jgi:hypothetical protein
MGRREAAKNTGRRRREGGVRRVSYSKRSFGVRRFPISTTATEGFPVESSMMSTPNPFGASGITGSNVAVAVSFPDAMRSLKNS